MNVESKKLKVLYILEIFPEISETFILLEMLGVRQHGADINIISLAKPKETGEKNNLESGMLLPITTYLSDVPVSEQYAALIYMFLKNPIGVITLARDLYKTEKYIRDTRNRLLQVCYLCRKAQKDKTDIIHAHFANPATSFSLWINQLTGIPFAFSSHGYDIFYVFPKDMKQKTEKAKKHLTVSRQAVRYIQDKIGPCDGKIQTLYNGIDVRAFTFNDDQENRDNVLLHVARLHPVKGQEYLLRACRLLKDRGLDFRCLIIGEGPQRPTLERLIKDLDLTETCFLLGSKTHDELIPYYQQAKVFVLTSVSEGLGNVLKEALACGLAVAASRVGGIPEVVIDGKTGCLFEVGNIEEIAQKILELWNDPQKRSYLTRNGRKLVEEEFDYQRQTKKLFDIWTNPVNRE